MAIQHTLFISTDRIKKDTALGGSVDDNLLLPYILMAQDRYILPVLGTDLNNALITKIQGSSLAGDYLRLRMVNNSIVTMSSEQGSSVSHSDLKPLINASIDQAEFYRERLIDYIRNNTSSLPEYQTNTGADLNPTSQNYYAGLNLDVAPMSNKTKSFLQGADITICC